MNFKLPLFGLLFFFASLLSATGQAGDDLPDSVLLEEVAIHSFSLHRFSAGSKIINIDSATLSRYRGNTLSDLLQQNTPLYFKTYGHGMISTINIRGTAASHTAVLWNGANINSMSLGLTDFSILPLFGIDNVSIHLGASSALYGSDAIGGTINLGSKPLWTKGIKVSLQQDAGSFQHYNTSIFSRYGNGSWEGRTAVYYKDHENNFPYINTTRINNPVELQENAAIQQKGLIQDLNYKISTKSHFSINTWWNETFRQVQPTMTVRNDDWQKDRNLKMMARYFFNPLQNWNGEIRLGYFNDLLNFNGSQSVIERYHSALEQDLVILKKLELKAGMDWNHIIADVSGYGATIIEDRNDIFLLSRFMPSKQWLLSLNVRQPFVSGFKAPLAPAFGATFKIIDGTVQEASWKLNLSQNYRIPTLNDRYWLQGGNKGLLPERSNNIETGFTYKINRENFLSEMELTTFFNDVKNWIAWIPVENTWTAQNIRRVKVRGAELVQKSTFQLNEFKLKLNVSYAFSRSTNEQSPNKDEIGKQLVYMPLHSGQINSELIYKSWFISPLLNYTGQRFTTSENLNSLPFYMLVDVFFGKSFFWSPFGFNAFIRINNLTNKIYQNYEHRAMPGRNFLISLRLDF